MYRCTSLCPVLRIRTRIRIWFESDSKILLVRIRIQIWIRILTRTKNCEQFFSPLNTIITVNLINIWWNLQKLFKNLKKFLCWICIRKLIRILTDFLTSFCRLIHEKKNCDVIPQLDCWRSLWRHAAVQILKHLVPIVWSRGIWRGFNSQ